MARYTRYVPRVSVGARRVSESSNPLEYDAQKSFRRVEKELQNFIGHVKGNMGFVLLDGLEMILETSKYLCPKDTGELVNSGYVATSKIGKNRVGAEVGYAKGGKPEYALVVHEDLTKYHEPPTQAKFLEDAIEMEADSFKSFLEMAMKDMSGL